MADMVEKKAPEKGLNLRIQECKEDIAAAVNKAKLPSGMVLMILNEFCTRMQEQNALAILNERKAYEEGVKQDGQSVQPD